MTNENPSGSESPTERDIESVLGHFDDGFTAGLAKQLLEMPADGDNCEGFALDNTGSDEMGQDRHYSASRKRRSYAPVGSVPTPTPAPVESPRAYSNNS